MLRNLSVPLVVLLVAAPSARAQLAVHEVRVQVSDAAAEQSVEAAALRLGEVRDFRARIAELNLDLSAAEEERDGALSLTFSLADTTGTDRAVDLDVLLPVRLEGWRWWHDINRSETLGPDSKLAEHQYPLIVLTPPTGDVGLCLAVEPSQPFVYELRAESAGLTVHAPLGLTPDGPGELKSRAEIRCYLFPTDAAWGFRDALARYYRLFPEAFERRAMAEGMWLFAFENSRLPNPSHYAYHEGGPNGWQYDEEHGIGTYPYTEVSSRSVHVPRLPKDREDALHVWRELQAESHLTLATWSLRDGKQDEQVARTGTTSLRCAKTAADAWVGATQDIPVNQEKPEPVLISGWLKAENVTGAQDRECSLYGDILLGNGEWLFGQIAEFAVGTHDWQQATWTVQSDQPVAMVRLHCLFRNGHTGTVWFDDISVTTASRPGENLCANPGFEERGSNPDVDAITAYSLYLADGGPTFFITTDFGSDVKPTTPLKLLRFTLNPSPYLTQAEGVEPPPGVKSLRNYLSMFENIPQLDGAYIDSVSSWATGYLNFRRDQFPCSRNPFTYDPETRAVVASGRYYTYDFLKELGDHLHPQNRYVFTNIHNTMDTFLLYAVSDVPGIESSITDHERFAYIRSASYHKPAVLLNFLNLHGFEAREKHDLHWRMALLYGLYPSIGRRCDEAYELYGDLYRRFMPSLMRISAAGWEPVTHARCDPPGPRIERFGVAPQGGLFFSVLNEQDDRYEGNLVVDLGSLGVSAGADLRALDTTTDAMTSFDAARAPISIAPHEVAVIQIGPPEAIAAVAQAELDAIVTDLARAGLGKPSDLRQALISAYNDPAQQERTWTGETWGQALLRAALVSARGSAAHADSVFLEAPDVAVGGEPGGARLLVNGAPSAATILLVKPDRLEVVENEFTWPATGYGPGLVDVVGLGSDQQPGGVMYTVRLREPIEVRLETEAPLELTPTRSFRITCLNHSTKARRLALVAEVVGGEGWQLTPAQREIEAPATSAVQTEVTVTAPPNVARLAEVTVRATSEGTEYSGSAQALCGQPQSLEPNLARAQGVQVTVDSNYQGGYNPAPLNDGLMWPSGVHWTARAWASAEGGGDHVIEFRWPRPVTAARVVVYWNVEGGGTHAARLLQVRAAEGEDWRQVAEVQPDPADAATTISFEPVRTNALRIVQPAGEGSQRRPNLMWVTEAQVGG